MVSTLSLTTKTSEFDVNFHPAIDLEDEKWEMGLLNFQSFNTIPNIDSTNNKFHFDNGKGVVTIPEGAYEVAQVIEHIISKVDEYYHERRDPDTEDEEVRILLLEADVKTLKTTIWCVYPIDFTQENSIGPFLGFTDKEKLEARTTYDSPSTLNISKVNVIRVLTNITTGAYVNEKPTQVIYEFTLAVDSGYRISSVPQNIIYFPIIVKKITNLHISVCDQNFNLVNFRGEQISILLHLRKHKDK